MEREAIKPDCFHSPKESSKSELMEWNKWIIKESCIMIFYTCMKYQSPSKYCDFQLYTSNGLDCDITTAFHVTPAAGYIRISLISAYV